MVAKAQARAIRSKPKPLDKPLEVILHVDVRFGEAEQEVVTVIDHRRLPLVGTVFEQRDAILRGLFRLLVRAGLTTPALLRSRRPHG